MSKILICEHAVFNINDQGALTITPDASVDNEEGRIELDRSEVGELFTWLEANRYG